MKKSELKEIILEAYIEVLKEENAVLPTNTDQLLSQYQELADTLKTLLSTKYRDFITNIDLASPIPTTFRINLLNGEFFYLKYLGEKFGFEAEIAGKGYNIKSERKQALAKLGELLRYNPISKGDEKAEAEAEDFGFEEPAAGGTPTGGETGAEIPEPETTTEPEFEEPGA